MMDAVEQLVNEFFSQFPTKTYEAGSVVIQTGKEPAGALFLESGLVRQFSVSKEGTERTLNVYKPGTFFPLSWVINQTPNRHTFEAVLDTTVRVAPIPAVVAFLQSHPEVMYSLLKRMFKALDGLLLQLENQPSGDAYTIILVTIVLLARRFGLEADQGTQITIPLTHAGLASYAGLSRETVTRTLQKLKTKNLVSYTHHTLSIPDLAQLETELAG